MRRDDGSDSLRDEFFLPAGQGVNETAPASTHRLKPCRPWQARRDR